MRQKVIIYGDSSFAQMVAHYFRTDSDYEVAAFCVDRAYRSRSEIDGCKVYDLEEITARFSTQDHAIFAAIGYTSVRRHKRLFEKIEALPFPIASYISSDAIVDESCQIGTNVLVLPGAVLEPHVCIGKNCFINSSATVCHNSSIEAHTILAAGSIVGGHVTVGESSLIGFNATVTELLTLGEETLLAAGSVLLQDTHKHTMYAGTPAMPVRRHKDEGIMLKPERSKKS